jgi:hypothetical protein
VKPNFESLNRAAFSAGSMRGSKALYSSIHASAPEEVPTGVDVQPGGGRARQAGDDTSDEAIEQALRRKAAWGDVAAARELRERARVKLEVATETTPRVVLEDMSNEELEGYESACCEWP